MAKLNVYFKNGSNVEVDASLLLFYGSKSLLSFIFFEDGINKNHLYHTNHFTKIELSFESEDDKQWLLILLAYFVFCVAGFLIASAFSVRIFIELKILDKKYTYINEIFKQYLDLQRKDDNHVSWVNKIKRQKSFD